ncbi:MAG: adenylate kinase [Thermomicrobiales bacterium]|nr:adenylate kinase [Thermomicrobiales bacterium]
MTAHIILLGPQGSGKGTQSERVRARLNLASIATGELFRSAIKGETELGKRIKAIYDRGELVPDDITVALVEERLSNQAGQGPHAELAGALYDGFPRTAAQAQALDDMLARRGEAVTVAIAIDVPREALIERLSGRRVCSVCGRVYNVVSDPPQRPGLCDVDGGELIQRADDTPEAVAKRLDLYELETAPLVERYAERGLVTRIDGDRSIDEVTDAVVSAIMERTAAAVRDPLA